MSWWDRLCGRAAPDPIPKTMFPASFDLVPGKLTARLCAHEIGDSGDPVPCWSYVTDGLAALQQKEVVFTLRRGHEEAVDGFPHDPFHLFTTLYQLASQGQRVDVGGFTQFGARGFFGHHLVYLNPRPLSGVTLPQSALLALLVTLDELRAVQEFGPTRLMARLGQASRYYPFPPWSDRLRRGLPFERTFQDSVLIQVTRELAMGVRVCQAGKQIELTAFRERQSDWQKQLQELPINTPVALLTDLGPSADGCLVWEPGQKEAAAITPLGSRGSRVGGCFVLFIPEQPADSGQILEDGFAVTLTTPSWAAVRRAFLDGQAITVPASGDGLSLSVAWQDNVVAGQDEVYVNPVDQKTYVASGGWVTCQPDSPRVAEPQSNRVKTEEVRLLTADADLAIRTTADDLAVFCKAVERCAAAALAASLGAFKVLVQFHCTCSGHQIQMAHQGDATPELLQKLSDSLAQLPKLPVRQADVTFQVQIAVSP